MPSFSKECLGGFVGFQGLAIDPNLFSIPASFLLSATLAPGGKKTLPICLKIFIVSFYHDILIRRRDLQAG
jgi:hypothetical protein